MTDVNLTGANPAEISKAETEAPETGPLLKIENLHVKYLTDDDEVFAVNGIDLELNEGESLGIVGETGAGKTTLALSILRLLPKGVGRIYDGSINFRGEDILQIPEGKMRMIRGNLISMIFQDPMTSLNPVHTVGAQIAEVLELHNVGNRAEIDRKVDDILTLVGIEPSRKQNYPHQFSGGMKQRIIIAMALACEPMLLIADEPTTALDVTIQAQILNMIDDIQKKMRTSMILITHDFGIIAEMCDKVAIMYAGEIVESGTLEQIFDKNARHHPYTTGLFGSIPDITSKKARLETIPGLMPDPTDLPPGCSFSPRCPHCFDPCLEAGVVPVASKEGHSIRCYLDQEASE